VKLLKQVRKALRSLSSTKLSRKEMPSELPPSCESQGAMLLHNPNDRAGSTLSRHLQSLKRACSCTAPTRLMLMASQGMQVLPSQSAELGQGYLTYPDCDMDGAAGVHSVIVDRCGPLICMHMACRQHLKASHHTRMMSMSLQYSMCSKMVLQGCGASAMHRHAIT